MLRVISQIIYLEKNEGIKKKYLKNIKAKKT